VKHSGHGALVGLNQLWYADYPRSDFHFINDNAEWLQTYSSYHLGRSAEMLEMELAKKAIDLRFWYGICFLTAVEVLDGFLLNGCFFRDIIANASALICLPGITVEGAADHTKIFFSYHAIRPVQTQCFRELTCGTNLKDYNGQTYWLSVNLHSFYKGSKNLNGLICYWLWSKRNVNWER
jgi:hypothetical protein